MNRTQKLTIAAVLVAAGIALSPLSIPVGIARCFPVQHMVNVIAGVMLGPAYAVAMAFATSLIRNLLGTGTLLAFPGSMFGALLAGWAAKSSRGRLPLACGGELLGTGVLGGLAAYPVAVYVMGREAAWLAYVLPFAVSSAGGAVIAFAILAVLARVGVFRTSLTNEE